MSGQNSLGVSAPHEPVLRGMPEGGDQEAAPNGGASSPILEVRGVVKDFPGMRALDHVDLTVKRGEIHALLGENGAGKSTLIKAVVGAHPPTAGTIRLEGKEVRFSNPHAAQAAGIAVVHQHSNLVPTMSVAENLWLGHPLPRRGGLAIDWRRVNARAAEVLAHVGISIEPSAQVSMLRPDQRAMVAIAKAIASEAKLIILDEPTTALLPQEVSVLFDRMRRLAEEGHGFLYVSHRLAEVFEIADRATVLRDGRVVGVFERDGLDRKAVIRAIVGKDADFGREVVERTDRGGEVVLHAKGLVGGVVREADLLVHSGEVLGLAGLPGSGADETLDLLFGRLPLRGGSVRIDGQTVSLRNPREAIRAGFALVPQDRIAEAMLHGFSVRENISVTTLSRFRSDPVFRFIRRRHERREAASVADRLNVKMGGIEAPIESLSGGNQQKTILARWFSSNARVYLLNSPTAAVDVGAKAEIYALVRQLAEGGATVIFTSTEVEEFPRVCDRVLVFKDGEVRGELIGDEANEASIMNLAVGE